MAAASRRSAAAKKRKQSASDDRSQPPPKKKSPLFNQPQKYYAPPAISSMSKDELSEWRKEQRRKRNRESAAASRNKTRAKIEELEGEANKWKRMYHEMEARVRCMERHIQFLTELNRDGGRPRTLSSPDLQALPHPAAAVSHPNSPPRSPSPSIGPPAVVPNAVTSFLAPPPTYSSHIAVSHDAEEGGEVEGIVSCGTPDATPAEASSSNEAKACERARAANPFSADDEDAGLDGYILPDPSSDADLLDVLADTLDGEFDPNLFI